MAQMGFSGKNLGTLGFDGCENSGMIWDFDFENGENFGISMDFQTHSCGLATHNTCRLDPWGSGGGSPLETWIATEKNAIAFLEGVRSTSFVVSSTSSKGFAWMKPSFFLGGCKLPQPYLYIQIPAFWLSMPSFCGSNDIWVRAKVRLDFWPGQIWGCRFRAFSPQIDRQLWGYQVISGEHHHFISFLYFTVQKTHRRHWDEGMSISLMVTTRRT